MGQAKNRGTFEQRVAQAQARQAEEGRVLGEKLAAEAKAEREAVIAARLDGTPLPESYVRRQRSRALSLSLAGLIGLSGRTMK
jgi:hypothetical protein